MNKPGPRTDLQQADIQWSDGLPVSRQFDDVYYSRENGLSESRHVFVDGNALPERWSALAKGEGFSIFETGFGTGLNFLCAAEYWLAATSPPATLHYISVEKYPLSQTAMAQALAQWPSLGDLVPELLQLYPPPVAGVHRLWLFENRICLTLIFDDAVSGFSQLLSSDHPALRCAGPAIADAWFLDGFAPAKNPDLWSQELFELMANFSHQQTTLATFTVARLVRDGLAAAGFELDKTPGYGRKREMLRGRFTGTTPTLPDPGSYIAPKFLRTGAHESPWYLHPDDTPRGNTVAIIGAGIAGCTTAAALRKRGYEVTVFDRHGVPGMEASGNPQGILYPKLSVEDSPLALFGRHALCYSLGFYQPYWESGNPGQQCGVLVLAENARENTLMAQIAERFQQAGSLVQALRGAEVCATAGVPLDTDSGLFYPALGWVSPPEVCRWLIRGMPITSIEIAGLDQCEDTGRWQLRDSRDQVVASADHVVIANSHQARQFSQSSYLPLRQIRGQITALPATPASVALKTVICGAGYIAPATGGVHTLGATYDVDDGTTDLRPADHLRNLDILAATDRLLTDTFADHSLSLNTLGGRAAVRCTTPDYLPIVGPVTEIQKMQQRFADLRRNARADIPLPGSFHGGLWLNVGHGSRGLTYAPLAAEILASQICGEISPVPRQLASAVNPARFIIRQLKRNV